MSWFGWGKKNKKDESAQEADEKPRRSAPPQQRRAAPAAREIPPEVMYGDQLKALKKQGYTDEQLLLEKLKIYGGDVNSVLMELDLEKTTSSSSQSPNKPPTGPPTGVEDAAEPSEKPKRKQAPPQQQSKPPAKQPKPQAKVEFSGNLRSCVASEIRQTLLRVSQPECKDAVERMYAQSVNGVRLYDLTAEEVSELGFPSQTVFNEILGKAEKIGPPQVSVSANDIDEKQAEQKATSEQVFKAGDAIVSQLGFGTIQQVRDDGIIEVELTGGTRGYFSPDALQLTTNTQQFSPGDIVISQMGRSKVLRTRPTDGMVVIETPTGSTGYFHPSSLELIADKDAPNFETGDVVMCTMGRSKVLRTRQSDGMVVVETPTGSTGYFAPSTLTKLNTKFFLRDQLPQIRSWTAATVREAVGQLYPELAERFYAASVNGARLLALEPDEAMHMSNLGNDFNAELYDRVAATLGLHKTPDQQLSSETMVKAGPVGDLATSLAVQDLSQQTGRKRRQSLSTPKKSVDSSSVSKLHKRRPSGPPTIHLSPEQAGHSEIAALAQRQTEQLGRLEDMMVEIDRLTLTPQLFDLRQRQTRVIKKLSGMLASLPNGEALVLQAQKEARQASFSMDEKELEEADAPKIAALAKRQDEVYARLVAAAKDLQAIAKQRGIKIPTMNLKPLPQIDVSMSSLERLIVRGKPEAATEAKTNPVTEPELYNPRGRGGAKKAPAGPLGNAVEAEAKEMDDMLTISYKLNDEKKPRTCQTPLSHGQKSIAILGIKNAIQSAIGETVKEVKRGKGKKQKILGDDFELPVGRAKKIEGLKISTA